MTPSLSRRAFLSGVLSLTALAAVPRAAVALQQEEDWRGRIQSALAGEGVFDGGGGTYGIAGTLNLPSGAVLRNLTIRQLAPSASQAVVTLAAENADRITLRNVTVNRNGTGENAGRNAPPNGPITSAYGIRISGGRGHVLRNIRVTGNDAGTAVLLRGLDGSTSIRNIRVHDMIGIVAGATDDILQGISLELCSGLRLAGLRCENMGWKDNAAARAVNTNCRAIVLSGCTGCSLIAPVCTNVGQGIDLSGNLGQGNSGCSITAARVTGCGTAGIKMANLTRRTVVTDCVAQDCGLFGFVDGSSFDSPVGDDDANLFIRCAAYDCGGPKGTSGGFLKLRGRRSLAYSNIPFFIDCTAVDRRSPPQMKWGFYNEVPLPPGARQRLVNCSSRGHVIAAVQGF